MARLILKFTMFIYYDAVSESDHSLTADAPFSLKYALSSKNHSETLYIFGNADII